MGGGDRCPVTQLPLQCPDIHRSLPPGSHAESMRRKRLHAPALPPCTRLARALQWDVTPRVLRPAGHLTSRGVCLRTRRLVPNAMVGRFPVPVLVPLQASAASSRRDPLDSSPLSFTSCARCPVFPVLDASDVGEGAVSQHPVPRLAVPDPLGGSVQGDPHSTRSVLPLYEDSGALAQPVSLRHAGALAAERGEARGWLHRRMPPASGGCTVPRLRQAPPLGDLSSPHGAFQGHAAHA